MFKRTTVINKIKNLNKFVKGVQGGTSALCPPIVIDRGIY